MAKRNRNKNRNMPNNNPRTNLTMAEKLKQEREEAALTDERVVAKLKELEEHKEKLDKDYSEKLEKLNVEKKKLETKLNEIEHRENEVLEAEEQLEKQKKIAAEEAIAEIKKDEQLIRADEYEKLKLAWDKEGEKQRKDLAQELADKKSETEAQLEKAHTLRVSAENERMERIHSADLDIQKKYAELTKEYQDKCEELNATIAEYNEKKREYEFDKADLEEEREYIEQLKERYNNCSETELKKLQLKIAHLGEINKVSQDTIDAQSKKIAKYEIRAIENNGQSAQERINELEDLYDKALSELDGYSNLPSKSRIEELELAEEQLRSVKNELDEIKSQLIKSKSQLESYSLDKRELQNARSVASALESMNEQLQKKLDFITEQYKSNQESKFQGLLKIDDEKYIPSERVEFNGTLEELVDYIRNYGATQKETPLYYSKETIMVFLASLAASEPASRLIVLQGLSGTGKSSLPELFKNALDIKWNSISVQPSWRDNRELLGYDNDFTNRFKETEFTKALYRASSKKYQDDIVLIVLDEMNLARIEYYFADFLSELEHRNSDWKIPLISSYTEPNEENRPQWLNYDNETANIVVTKNIWFVGTANNDDSTSLITDKVYDRAQILDMDERESDFVGKKVKPQRIAYSALQSLFQKAKRTKSNQLTPDDWSNIEYIDENILQKMDITFGNRMKTQLNDFVPVYVACGGTKAGAIDYFLAHKILRKLDDKYDVYIADCLKELIEGLNSIYGENVFERSLKKIGVIKKRNFSTGE